MREEHAHRGIAIVGLGAIMPDAPDVMTFWENIKGGRYSISEVRADRWDPAHYYDPDPLAVDRTYSKIGGWVRSWEWDPVKWHLPIPPKVAASMDDGQKWGIACTRAALADYGYPKRPLNPERTAVIIGNAMAGELHYKTALRIFFPEFAQALDAAPSFRALPDAVRSAINAEARERMGARIPQITEDTMPGELSNVIAGRIANLFDLHGPNYVVDAACASAMAAFDAAVEGLVQEEFDSVITGGIDRNMGASAYVKFSKIGALSATGTRPYADGADGFVMGEGAALFLLKRLADAERDHDRIYAVIRGIGGASDGKGKGITAPNPVGQKLAIQRAWQDAGVSPASVGLIEGHGTSTKVGDLVEVTALSESFAGLGLAPGSIALGSVKSNIGHLKAAAGAAGILKATLALHEKMLPPSLHFERPNPNLDWSKSPFRVNTELREWSAPADGVRRAGVSAFGFGGTNFHVALEEYVPGRIDARPKRLFTPAVAVNAGGGGEQARAGEGSGAARAAAEEVAAPRAPLRGALVVGGGSVDEIRTRLVEIEAAAKAGRAPERAAPSEKDLRAKERLAIDYGDPAELSDKIGKAQKALAASPAGTGPAWKALRAQGVFRGHGPAHKVAFLYTGQGSQYVNMLSKLRDVEPIVAETFAEADRVMTPLLGGRSLSSYIFIDAKDPAQVSAAEEALRQTAITQPAVLATDLSLTRLFGAYGIAPDMVMGHSLGEYGALVAAGALPLGDALEAVSARGREMTRVSVEDNGAMAAVMAPIEAVEKILATVEGYVVLANVNSRNQAVVGGATTAVEAAISRFQAAGFTAIRLPVSHAFHTRIVAQASDPLREVLERLRLTTPSLPTVANVTGELYPMGPGARGAVLDLLSRQVAAPVQFVKGLETLHGEGARVFVEVGPKKALQGFVDDVLGERPDVVALFSNHPKLDDVVAFNQALCGLYAAGLGVGRAARTGVSTGASAAPDESRNEGSSGAPMTTSNVAQDPALAGIAPSSYADIGRQFVEFLARTHLGGGRPADAPVVVTGAALGLPGTERVFDDHNLARLLAGEQFIDVLPTRFRRAMVEKHITRLVKSEEQGASFEPIDSASDVIKLAARKGALDLVEQFGVAADRIPALDVVTRLAIGAGIDALRDAGIPLVLTYKKTHKGTFLPDRWQLPASLRDDTGVIFASAFPGLDAFAEELTRLTRDHARREQLASLETLRARVVASEGHHDVLVAEIDRRVAEVRAEIESDPCHFDRRFLFRVLSMGHSQFAELVGARGPNTQINSACASTTQAVSLAEDWIRAGRCRRVLVIAADDATSDHLMEWMGAGFLASGAAATDDEVEKAALPFDKRRHGMIIGMGAAALVVESAEAAAERGLAPICEVLAAETANSAFHGTRLDIAHIGQVMERLVARAESRGGVSRDRMAGQLLFVSHETYTPARGGSAAAEVHALREVFGANADRIVVANTKGFTGHPMGVGIEDVVAVKAVETGIVPPIPNFKEVDPDLGRLNLSRGGSYPVEYALRLGAGFGSQISMTLIRRVAPLDGRRRAPDQLGFAYRVVDRAAHQRWLDGVSGQVGAELEVVKRTLRLRDKGPSKTEAAPSRLSSGPSAPTPASREPVANLAPAAPLAPSPAPRITPVVATPAAAPIAPVVAAPAAAPIAATPIDPIRAKVLAIVAEKTGYPVDMLDPELDLEADLGIDTVKQAETFAAVRAAWDIPRVENLKLRDFPTLGHVMQFVRDKRPDLVVAAVAPPAAIAAPTPVPADLGPAPATDGDPIRAKVLAIVAEKTGYPVDMLDPELDLEADLGIDTVKQAETFAAVRAAWDIPRVENLKLRDFPTLGHVMQFVRDKRPDLVVAEAAPAADMTSAPPAATPAPSRAHPTVSSLEAADRMPRRVPVPLLRPALALCKPTGIEIGAGSRVIVMADRGGVAAALAERLLARGAELLLVDDAPAAQALDERVRAFAAAGRVHGVYWLPALDDEGDLGALTPEAFREALRLRVKLLYTAARALYAELGERGHFFVSATRLGGRHGYDAAGATSPLGGAVTGFTKALKREREAAVVKAIDFGADDLAGTVADRIFAETEIDPGAVEIGWTGAERYAVGLVERPAQDGRPGVALGPDTVFLVTGAAGAITSAIVADLAGASGGTFHLFDLVPEPDADNPDLARVTSDRDGLKRDLFERLKARGERATPVMIDRELASIERAACALSSITAVRAAGGRATWHRADLRDPAAVSTEVAAALATSGRIDVLVHAAGLEISRFLPDKQPSEFDLVFDVKAEGFFHLLHALGDHPLAATVVFSSIAGRFGNGGQTDYSAANDLLCKMTSSFRRARPATHGVAIDWTAWAEIGMAARGSIPKMMELAGIEMLPPAAGVPAVRRELVHGGGRGEVVVAGRLGILAAEFDETGGLDTARADETGGPSGDAGARPRHPMIGRIVGSPVGAGLVVETALDPAVQPFLYDHRIDGTPVLPGVMGMEAFAEIAALLAPGRRVVSVEDVVFHAPFKFYRDQPRTVRLEARLLGEEEDLLAECRLIGTRALAGRAEPEITVHFTGRVRLARSDRAPAGITPDDLSQAGGPSGKTVESDAIYRVYFHGPAYRVLESAWRDGDRTVGLYPEALPPNQVPATASLAAAPRLVELCFQTAGICGFEKNGQMALPAGVARLQVAGDPAAAHGRLRAVVHERDSGTFDARVLDDAGLVLVRLDGYRTVEVPGRLDEAALAPLRLS